MTNTKNTIIYDSNSLDLPIKLIYGSDKASIIPESIIDFENRRRFNKIEFGILVSDKKVLEENRGSKGVVYMTVAYYKKATVFSHIHPRNNGIIGGTFSYTDLDNFVEFTNLRTYRAVAREGIYSITKLNNFNSNLAKAYKKYDNKIDKETDKLIDIEKQKLDDLHAFLQRQLNIGILTQEMSDRIYENAKNNYLKKYNSIYNLYLIKSHNWLIKNQKKYGYSYGLMTI